MSYSPAENPQEKKSLFGVIIHSFFVVPFLLAVFSVLLFAAVRILTMEKHSVYDYLKDVKEGGATKRWQAAFELSRSLSSKDQSINDDKFVSEMISAFEASKHDDERVRQYLALAMARTGNEFFVEPLLKDLINSKDNITQEKDENLYAIITSLGILKSIKAVNVLLDFLNHSNVRIRLATVIALGNIGDPNAVEQLKPMLNDSEPNVVWDASIALAKLDDQSGRNNILKLLDRDYLNGFTNVTSQAQTHIMLVAMQSTANWNDKEINVVLKKLFESDKNMNVRVLAHKIMEQQKI